MGGNLPSVHCALFLKVVRQYPPAFRTLEKQMQEGGGGRISLLPALLLNASVMFVETGSAD